MNWARARAFTESLVPFLEVGPGKEQEWPYPKFTCLNLSHCSCSSETRLSLPWAGLVFMVVLLLLQSSGAQDLRLRRLAWRLVSRVGQEPTHPSYKLLPVTNYGKGVLEPPS